MNNNHESQSGLCEDGTLKDYVQVTERTFLEHFVLCLGKRLEAQPNGTILCYDQDSLVGINDRDNGVWYLHNSYVKVVLGKHIGYHTFVVYDRLIDIPERCPINFSKCTHYALDEDGLLLVFTAKPEPNPNSCGVGRWECLDGDGFVLGQFEVANFNWLTTLREL